MTTTEGNKSIAEFMGAVEAHLPFSNDYMQMESNPFPNLMWTTKISDLEYHTSWDWLMPVVEKISNITIEGHPPFTGDQFVRVEIVPSGYVKIENLRDAPIFTNVSKQGSLISAIWHAVVQFIQWFNTQSLNTKTDKQ